MYRIEARRLRQRPPVYRREAKRLQQRPTNDTKLTRTRSTRRSDKPHNKIINNTATNANHANHTSNTRNSNNMKRNT